MEGLKKIRVIFFLMALSLSFKAHSAQKAWVNTDKAVVYADLNLTTAIGVLRFRKEIMIGSVARRNDSVFPIVVAGKIAYVKKEDLIFTNPHQNMEAYVPKRTNFGDFRFFFFYSLSQGKNTETVANSSNELTTEYKSPITLGMGGHYSFPESKYSISGSFYYSKLSSFKSNLTNDNIDLGWESGTTLHMMKNIGREWYMYGGIDTESLPVQNTVELLNSRAGRERKANLFYGLFGFMKRFNFATENFFIKLSVAKSFKADSSPASLNSNEEFEGERYLAHFTHKFTPRFSYHFFYKIHKLEGPTTLDIQRYGLGIGYDFY